MRSIKIGDNMDFYDFNEVSGVEYLWFFLDINNYGYWRIYI